LVGRLEGRVSLAQGASALRSASLEIGRRDPQSNGGLVFEPLPLANRLLGAVPLSLYAAAAAAALVMFLVFVNLGGLSLSRSIAMQRDFAVRRALGASTARLFRQLAGQWLVVCGASGLASVVLARGVLHGVVSSGAFTLPSFVDASITAQILLSVPVLTAIGTIVAASAPVLLARHSALALVSTTNRSSATPAVRRLGQALIFAQVGVAAALLFTGVLMVRSVLHLQGGDLGWNPAGTAAMRIDLLGERYLQEAAKWRFADDLLSRLRSRLQVPAALSGPGGVPTGELFLTRLTIEDFRPPDGDVTPFLSWHLVTPDYFDILGIQLRRGRFFTTADKAGGQPVAIVTDSFGKRFWPGADPVGRRLKLGARDNPAAPWVTVVGVTADVDFEAHARERDVVANEHFFVPFAQRAPSQPARAHLIVKTDRLATVAAAARDALREVAPTLPIHAPIVLSDALERQTVRDRMIAALLTFLGATAFVVSVLGIYCTVAFEVSSRAPEYGIRLALGAARAHIVQLATAHTAVVVGGGLIAGLATGAALASLGRGLLFGVQPADTGTTVLVAGLLAAGAGLGMWRPLRRAALTDPASVLRQN
jgi:predicted permease